MAEVGVRVLVDVLLDLLPVSPAIAGSWVDVHRTDLLPAGAPAYRRKRPARGLYLLIVLINSAMASTSMENPAR